MLSFSNSQERIMQSIAYVWTTGNGQRRSQHTLRLLLFSLLPHSLTRTGAYCFLVVPHSSTPCNDPDQCVWVFLGERPFLVFGNHHGAANDLPNRDWLVQKRAPCPFLVNMNRSKYAPRRLVLLCEASETSDRFPDSTCRRCSLGDISCLSHCGMIGAWRYPSQGQVNQRHFIRCLYHPSQPANRIGNRS